MDNVDFLIKLRDASQMIADAANDFLEQLGPKDSAHNWNPDNILWEKAEGARGIYEKAAEQENMDFKELLVDLKKHSGKLRRADHFYWLFDRGPVTVGRKRK